ncbi:CT620/CT621 family type III secretion system effector [Chlamydia ibidis]
MMDTPFIERYQPYSYLRERPIESERRVSPAEVAADYTKVNEIAHQLQVFQDLLKEASILGLRQELIDSLNREFLQSGAEMALLQTTLAEQNSKEMRKQEKKAFQAHFDKVSPKALTTAPELHPDESGNSVINKMPFQSAFAYILLDKYIPSQESALYALGQELNLSGYAQNLFSPLLEAVKTFNSAPIVYNLGSYISQTSGTSNFKYGYQMVKNRFEEERLALRNDIKNAEQATVLLGKIIKNINSNPSLSEAQKTQLVESANSYIKELEICLVQMKKLMNSLNSLVFIPGSSVYEPSYQIMGSDFSVVEIQTLEGLVVDGEIDIETGTTKGGLLNFFNQCLSDVQNYGDLAQTTQIMLELQLRAMQQEWNLVSASLKIMHNVYRTLISGCR